MTDVVLIAVALLVVAPLVVVFGGRLYDRLSDDALTRKQNRDE